MKPFRVVVATDRIGDLDSLAAGVALARGIAEHAQVAVVPLAAGGPDLAVAFASLAGAEPVFEARPQSVPDAPPQSGVDVQPVPGEPPRNEFGAQPVPGEPPRNELGAQPVPGELPRDEFGSQPVPEEPPRNEAASRRAPAPDWDRWLVRTPGRVLLGLLQPAVPAWAPNASTADFGDWIAMNVRDAQEVILDLTGLTAHDGGAGLLERARPCLEGRKVVGLVGADELTLPATGIGGGLARRAFAGRVDVAELLRADAALAAWAEGLREGIHVAPGGGAAGTAALAVLALGGDLTTATQFCYQQARLGDTIKASDLVVTGCRELSALDRGGPVVSAVAGWADTAQRPCVLFTTGPGLARRELRTMGIEAAHLIASERPSEAELSRAGARIAAGWVTGLAPAHLD